MITYAQVKPGMLLDVEGHDHALRVTGKHNGTETLLVLHPLEIEPLRIEMSEVLGRVAPDPLAQIHPMLAKNVDDLKGMDKDALLASPEWGLEEKYDGERQILSWISRSGRFNVFRATTRVVGKNTGLLAENSVRIPQLRHVLRLGIKSTRVFRHLNFVRIKEDVAPSSCVYVPVQ